MIVSPTIPTSSEITEEVREAYRASTLVISRRIQIYEADGITLWRPDDMQDRLIDGSISIDADRDERRSLNGLTLFNRDGLLNQDSEGGFWYDKIIKVYRGLIYRDTLGEQKKFEIQVGEFMIDSISDERFPKTVSISGRDYAKKLLLDMFPVDTSFAGGQPLDTLVRTIATNAGIKKFRLAATGITVGTTAVFGRKSSRWEAIKSLCNGLNVEVFFDREGYLTTKVYDDVTTTPPQIWLSREEGQENIIDFSKATSDSNIFNHVVVIGTSEEETATGYKWISQRSNTDLSSPTCIAKIGRRTFEFEVSYITSQPDADNLAIRLLKVKQLEDFTLTFSTVSLPWMEVGRILQFIDPFAPDSVPTRFLFTNFDMPLGLGGISGTGKRIMIVGLTEEDQGGVDIEP